jgi:hypothetical protein
MSARYPSYLHFKRTNRCAYCGVNMTPATHCGHVDTEVSRDHIIPVSRGGHPHQWVLVCRGCNHDKFTLALNEWRAVLAVRYRTVPVFWFEQQSVRACVKLTVLKLATFALYIF